MVAGCHLQVRGRGQFAHGRRGRAHLEARAGDLLRVATAGVVHIGGELDHQRIDRCILFILQRAPYGNTAAREILDAALAAAAFEQDVQLLFSGEGVWQLLPGQQPDAFAGKDISKMLQALGYYDIEAVYADAVSLAERGLDSTTLALPVMALDPAAQQQLLRTADCVITL